MATVWAVWGPAVLAAGVAIAATVAIERLGGVRGGLIATLPTTIVPASFGIHAGAADPVAFREAMCAVPVGMLINGLFLWTWRTLPPRLPALPLAARLGIMAGASLAVWALAAAVGVAVLEALRRAGLSPLVLGGLTFALLVAVGVVACLAPRPAPKGGRRVGPAVLVARGVLAGAAIGVAGLLAASGVPLLAGMASVFPAIFLTTMVSLWWAQGEAVPSGAVGPMMLGSASVSAYALYAAVAFPAAGPAIGAALAWGLAVVTVTVPAARWLARRLRRGTP